MFASEWLPVSLQQVTFVVPCLCTMQMLSGIVGSVAQLGTTISEMEKNVSGLQKNIDTLKTVKAALGGK